MDSDQVQYQLEQQLQHIPMTSANIFPSWEEERNIQHMQTIITVKEPKKKEGEYTSICQTKKDPKSQIPTDESRWLFCFFF